ncbi:MAG TPA: ATP synthase F1 subunit delta [Melioribacteraceae bacterium]|nr:ATP synthase F1 subunit delta [Melioribacteraceae bacterium]
MSDFNVSTRYANALLAIAIETNQFEVISNDVDYVLDVFANVKALKVAIYSPVIKLEKKIQILEEVFKAKISSKTFEFLTFLLNKRRDTLLISILKRYCTLRDNKKGVANVKVKVAFDISEEQKNKLKDKLEEITKKQVTLSIQKDELIIGGFIARHEDTVYDASIKHSLELLKKQFLEGEKVLN